MQAKRRPKLTVAISLVCVGTPQGIWTRAVLVETFWKNARNRSRRNYGGGFCLLRRFRGLNTKVSRSLGGGLRLTYRAI